MILASFTDSFVHLATNVVNDLGLVGIFLLMLAESACIPIPSEATMLFAGFSVSEGHYSLLAITIAGVAGNLAGSWISYGVGYYGRMELVERHGHKVHIKPSHVEWADRWFSRYGEATVFFARLLPIIRTFISLPAGVARMPFWRFTLFTLLGCIPWVFLLGFAGDQVGHNWTKWKDSLSYVDYVVVVLAIAGIVFLIARRRRRSKASVTAVADASSTPGVDPAERLGADAEPESRLSRNV
jgi:membrane protein DedA with SNARE-associated domain